MTPIDPCVNLDKHSTLKQANLTNAVEIIENAISFLFFIVFSWVVSKLK